MDAGTEIRRVLLEQWDPLAIRDQPAAHPAYDCFVQDLTLIIVGGGTDDEVADYLRSAETTRLSDVAPDERRLARTVDALRKTRAGR